MADSAGGLLDRFALALERAPGIDVIDGEALVLRVQAADDRVAMIRVEADALASSARRAIEEGDVDGLAGADPTDQFFTLFFLHVEAALADAPRRRMLFFRFGEHGMVRVHD